MQLRHEPALVIADIEVKHAAAHSSCEVLANLVSKRRDARVLDGYFV
jgi:hypothetical protein